MPTAIPPMDPNLKQLLLALNGRNVRYLIIGGYAVSLHGQPRMTKDLDVFIESTELNAKAVFQALAEFGAPMNSFTVQDFCDGTIGARFGNPPICFDILQRIDGVDFETTYANSVSFLIDEDLSARYISADDFITNKLASGRVRSSLGPCERRSSSQSSASRDTKGRIA